jgi:WD40-like Beta Propeller Repeat
VNSVLSRLTSVTATICTLLVVAFSTLVLSSCNTASPPDQRSVSITTAGTPTSATTIPPPVGTVEPPTTTPAPILPTNTPAPLPRPPRATTLPVLTPTPGAATPTLSAKASGGLDPNIAWGVATDSELTIWVGAYSDTPAPSISNSRAIVKWATPLTLLDMAVSPDHQSLAVLAVNPPMPNEEGVRPTWLYVIDLSTNAVQGVPDYDNYYSLYQYYYFQSPDRILGWLDNNNFSVQQVADFAVAIANKNGAAYAKLPFPTDNNAAPETALSADRTTFFSLVTGEDGAFWLYNADGSNPRKVVSADAAKALYRPTWSPDGKSISFLSPQIETHEDSDLLNFQHLNIWLLDLASSSQQPISKDIVWDVQPAWALDSSKIAFLRADSPVTDDNLSVSYDNPTQVNTNIFVASTSDLTPKQLTGFQNVSNTGLSWTPDGNLVLASSFQSAYPGTPDGLPNLIAVSSKDATTTTLISSPKGQVLEHPILFR